MHFMKQSKQYFLIPISLWFVSILFYSCKTPQAISKQQAEVNYNNRRLLLRDEGLSQLSYVDLANTTNNWYVPVPPGRDMQLVGRERVLIGTGTGYEEREIKTGKKIFEVTSFPGTLSARRLKNGNTLLAGVGWHGKKGIGLVEVNKAGTIERIINYPTYNYVRLVRETLSGNFLITTGTTVFEANKEGNIVWNANITGVDKPNAWQALRLANGQTIVSSGYSKNFQVFSSEGSLITTITGPKEVNPNFFAGFQIVGNGNYVVTNWQGHGAKFGTSGTQVLEYSPDGKLVWSWKQDAEKFSSIQGVIVLDGLNTSFLHVENASGILTPVK